MKKSILLGLWAMTALATHNGADEYWDWSKIDASQIEVPTNFLWGTAVAEHQVSGAQTLTNGNWAFWEKNHWMPKSNKACDFWNRCFDDIKLMKELGTNAFRFSLDWSMIEPQEGVFDEGAIKHYKDFCVALHEQGIEPMVTLHHFVHPQWFEEKGGFSNEENQKYFVRFSQKMFGELADQVTWWCTFNEPTVFVLGGYIRGGFPPGVFDLHQAGRVLCNLLKSHVAVYRALKAMPHGDTAQVGIVHNMMPIKPFSKNIFLRTIEQFFVDHMDHILNESVMNFFKDGTFTFYIPKSNCLSLLRSLPRIGARVNCFVEGAPQALDFFGINYYCQTRLQLSWRRGLWQGYTKEDIVTDMPYAFYPEGLYQVIAQAAQLKVPIYITENGISDARDDRKQLWIERYTYAMHKAIKDGYDVRGYFYWSLLDNFEWDLGYNQKFGLYEVNFETQERTLRNGSKAFQDRVKRSLQKA